jgi:hypothetical protein
VVMGITSLIVPAFGVSIAIISHTQTVNFLLTLMFLATL